MNPAAILAVVSLIREVVASMEALKAISDLIAQKQASGEDVTLDDLKGLQLADGTARDMLIAAIEEAEQG